MGVLPISGKKGRREEFNPFAKDAPQQHRRRREDRERRQQRAPPSTTETRPTPQVDIQADLERKQKEAQEKLVQKGDVVAPVVAPAPVPKEIPRPEHDESTQPLTREDRLAEMRRKSEAVRKTANVLQSETSVTVVVEELDEKASGDDESPDFQTTVLQDEIVGIKANSSRVKNVFKQIETKVESKQDRRRSRRRGDKKGGGRQKQQKKLNRQKYLEYKYAAKDVLDDPGVPEEHRSNVLGQIWAKGERQGIDDCLEYIEQKEAELILPAEVGDKLRELIRSMTTRR